MSVKIQGELQDQLTAFAIDPALTGRLAGIYYRNIARRLWQYYGPDQELPGGELGWQKVSWLHPRAVWASMMVGAARPVPSAYASDVLSDMAAAVAGIAPAVEHLPGEAPARWYEDGLDFVARDLNRGDGDHPRPTDQPITRASGFMDEAAVVLARVWPEAAAEFRALIRAFVYTEGPRFYSATDQTTFGTIYVGLRTVTDVPAAFETLLHETGHHSLVLRNAFEAFTTNGLDMASHPLRSDPRPIFGIIHAAHVLTRMATGLSRWANEPGVDPEVARRRDEALRMLRVTLQTLQERARWTPSGERFFAGLLAQEAELRADA